MEQYLNESDSVKVEISGAGVVAWARRLGSDFEEDLELCEQNGRQDL